AAADSRSAGASAVCRSRGTSSARATTTLACRSSGRLSRKCSTAARVGREAICSTSSPPTGAGLGSISEPELFEGLVQPVEATRADEADRPRGQPEAPGDLGVGNGRVLPEEEPHHLLAAVGQAADRLAHELFPLQLGGD